MDDKELQSLLFSAILHHNDTLLDDLLNGEHAERFLDQTGQDGKMLLHVAVEENHVDCVECLLKHGADPNVFDLIKSRTPVHLAVELGLIEVVKIFLKFDHVNLDIRDDRNLTCLEIAQFCDNQSLVDLIRTRQDEINRIKNDFYSIINQACSKNDEKLVREHLERQKTQILLRLPRRWSSEREKRESLQHSSIKELINWSSSSCNDVTLLFKFASKGFTEVCRVLIEYGATARCNESTNHSPLYVAAYGGYTETVELLLDRFPSLVQEVTIERWTVLHACCLQGNHETAKLILNYNYPEKLRKRFVSRSGHYEYHFAFDLNAQDAAGQTVIYLAVLANDENLLDTLLHFNVEAKLCNSTSSATSTSDQKTGIYLTNEVRYKLRDRTGTSSRHTRIIPDRPKLLQNTKAFEKGSDSQLNRIIRQLHKLDTADIPSDSTKSKGDDTGTGNKYLICPFEMDTYCDYNSKTALHLAVCQQYHSIATTLLVNGSNPNLPILSRDSIKNDFNNSSVDVGLNWLRSSKSTCLKEASRLNDEIMCDILIRYGASDNQDNLALQVAAANKNNRLISKFLSLKSNVDPEFKINKRCNVEFAARYKQNNEMRKHDQASSTTTFSSMFPSVPVMIDWQNLRCIKSIDPQWLIDASLMHNKRLKYPTTSLLAITRLDMSSNNLKSIHPVIFRLPSLRELNLSMNRLESLNDNQRRSVDSGTATGPLSATSKLIESHKVAMRRSKSTNLSPIDLERSNIIDLNEPQDWDLPQLEVLDLHDNRLISLPDCLFRLPKLSELDISSNQIRQLPWSMWSAPALKEVIASKNLLDDLPRKPQHSRKSISPNMRIDSSDSPTDGRSSVASNHSASIDKVHDSLASSSSSERNQPDFSGSSSLQLHSVQLELNHLNSWGKRIDFVRSSAMMETKLSVESNQEQTKSLSKITYLNISHNSFSTMPTGLACVATELNRLNMSNNRLSSLGDVRLYPNKLKNLDLSYNQISCWFHEILSDEEANYCHIETCSQDKSELAEYLRESNVLNCPHKLHCRLDQLRSLNLSHNQLTDIQIATRKEAEKVINLTKITSSRPGNHSHESSSCLMYPNVTALDVSFNKISGVPKAMSVLRDLSVLNVSANQQIHTLPAELGLANKLWNLGVTGCNLNEPLKSIVGSKNYKTMDIIGYLKSILEEAKPYARMKLMLVGIQGIGKTSLLEQMRQESGSVSRRRAPEHWTKRMGHSARNNLRNQRGVTLSTVGVDIHDWIYCKRAMRNQTNFGPVSFSTWDFGGQQEFYATHRYFLSRRSIYLVVWRLTDGIEGIIEIQQWLVNIQSRAPSSPVIIVGTHEDLVDGGERGEIVCRLQDEVHRRFMDVTDHDKCGLPRVMDSIVVSTKTKLNIKYLCDRIYDIVFSLRSPGGSERLLEQKIPATYLYLEEIVNWIVQERHKRRKEPVMSYEEYRALASEQLEDRYSKTFRDLEPLSSKEINYNSELQQATRFLHENGVLLHYEDANLRDLYFLDPQWLCDVLSHVVTIREINPHVKNGLMKIDDLGFLFKSIDINLSGGIQSYVVNLLNKFEVALTWNSQYLLIPSLLPDDPRSINDQQELHVKMTPRMRGRSVMRKYDPTKAGGRASSIGPMKVVSPRPQSVVRNRRLIVNYRTEKTIHRLVLLRYLPAGFLARLQSGILSDPMYDDICADLHDHLVGCLGDDSSASEIGCHSGWTCWKRGIGLTLQREPTINSQLSDKEEKPISLLNVRELKTTDKDASIWGRKFKVEYAQVSREQAQQSSSNQTLDADSVVTEVITSEWTGFDPSEYSNIILISVPSWTLRVTNEDNSVDYIEPDRQSIAKLMSTTVDHIDNLLEDWYPSLGARFAHTMGGSYLVTRIAPCIECFSGSNVNNNNQQRVSRANARSSRYTSSKINFSISSAKGTGLNMSHLNQPISSSIDGCELVHCFYVEHCILNAYHTPNSTQVGAANPRRFTLIDESKVQDTRRRPRYVRCPKHGLIALNSIAPDIIFDDIPEPCKIDNEQIERCKLIGRGTFGFVFRGSLRSTYPLNQLGQADQEVALKLLQPVNPGPDADNNDICAYKSALSGWHREPFQSACKSYCIARHEVNILQSLHHPNIVMFIGLCIKPLAIVLELAPLGCLTDVFKNYQRAGMRIDQYSVQKTILQIAKALEFLHQQRVIYRDLKAENVLVWSFPSPFATQLQASSVELKLADYGISRQALSTGIWKGFAGTINFLAPEILRHNGDEEYTEKVDCFSFGMFMYELVTLRPPYKHTEGAKSYLADGARPSLSPRDLAYPSHVIDLMSVCWSQEPHLRPTASQIVSIASAPEFLQLLDAVDLNSRNEIKLCSAIQYCDGLNSSELNLWLGHKSEFRTEILSSNPDSWEEFCRLVGGDDLKCSGIEATSMCVVDNNIWLCDSKMVMRVLPLGGRLQNSKDTRCHLKRNKSASFQDDEVLNQVQSFPIKARLTADTKTTVQQMVHVKSANSIVLLTTDGKMWIYQLENQQLKQIDDCSIKFACFDIHEPDTNQLISIDETGFQIYCGQSNGISCFQIIADEVLRQRILPLAGKPHDLSGERIVEPSQSTEVTCIVASERYLWTSAGCTVHLWSVADKCVARKLDCWKLVPCSESLESINIESYYEQARSSVVSSIVHSGNNLFVGTSHGCFMVVEADSLKPVIVFRPYDSDIRIITPTMINDDNPDQDQARYLVSVGKGYRDLMKRYVNSLDDSENNENYVAILWSAKYYNL